MSITPLSNPLTRRLFVSDRRVADASEHLATGSRIVRASDDAAGLTTAERLQARHRGLAAAERSAMDGMNMVRTADGALSALQAQLQRVRELAVQWSNGTLSDTDRAAIEAEAAAFGEEAARLYESTSFNGISLLQGGTMSVHVGAGDGESISSALPDLVPVLEEDPFTFDQSETTTSGPSAPGGKAVGWYKKNGTGTTGTTTTSTMNPIERVDWAIEAITEHRSRLGATENRLDHRIRALATEQEQLLVAESRIRDVDVADAVSELTIASIMRNTQSALMEQAQQLDRRRVLALLN